MLQEKAGPIAGPRLPHGSGIAAAGRYRSGHAEAAQNSQAACLTARETGMHRQSEPTGTTIAKGRWSPTAWWPWLLAASAVAAAAATETTVRRREVRTVDGRQVTGAVVVEAADGGLLLEEDDGRYELFQPGQIAACETATTAEPPSPRELGRRILADLPAGFELLVTNHYIVCHDTSSNDSTTRSAPSGRERGWRCTIRSGRWWW